MAEKREKPEDIVLKLRQVEVLAMAEKQSSPFLGTLSTPRNKPIMKNRDRLQVSGGDVDRPLNIRYDLFIPLGGVT